MTCFFNNNNKHNALILQCFFMFNLDCLVHLDQCCTWNLNYGFEMLLICAQLNCKSSNYYDAEMEFRIDCICEREENEMEEKEIQGT